MTLNTIQLTRVVRITSLVDFAVEAPPGACLNGDKPIARLSGIRVEGQHHAALALHLQAVNTQGEIVWLAEVHHVGWLYGQPFGKDAESICEGMEELERIVRECLNAQGYIVREGDYGLPDSIKPLAAKFECARWAKNDGGTYRVEAA